MNMEVVTIQDCLDMQHRKGMDTILVAGHVVGFEQRNELVQEKRFPVGVTAPAGTSSD